MDQVEAVLHELRIGRHPAHFVYGDEDRTVEVLVVFGCSGTGCAAGARQREARGRHYYRYETGCVDSHVFFSPFRAGSGTVRPEVTRRRQLAVTPIPATDWEDGAGDRDRTGDQQLGRLRMF